MLDPKLKTGELSLLLVRIYRVLYTKVDEDTEQMIHWLHTENCHVQGAPIKPAKALKVLVAWLSTWIRLMLRIPLKMISPCD